MSYPEPKIFENVFEKHFENYCERVGTIRLTTDFKNKQRTTSTSMNNECVKFTHRDCRDAMIRSAWHNATF